MESLRQVLGLKSSVRLCSHQCNILHEALAEVRVFLSDFFEDGFPVSWEHVNTVMRRTGKLLSSCESDGNWVVNALLFEERREDFQVVHAQLYDVIDLMSVKIFHTDSQLKSLVHEAYSLCMAKKHSAEDLERAAGLDRAELLDRIDQQMKKSADKKKQMLQKLKHLLEVRGRVFIDHEELTFKGHIGHGASGSVYEATWLGHPFAVKVFQAGDKTFPRELGVLSSVKHPNILHIAGQSYKPHQDQHMLLMEKMDMDLAAFLNKRKAPLETSTLLSIVLQVATGMAWLHSRQIIHRDLKPQNVLVACQGDDIIVRVADFGLAKTGFITSLVTGATSRRGTKNYMAPEVWTSEKYSKKADVYSFGMLCYQVVTLKAPFQDEEADFMQSVVHSGLRPSLQESILTELITECWRQEPSERPEFSEVCYKLKMVQATYLTGLPEITRARKEFLEFSRRLLNVEHVIGRLWTTGTLSTETEREISEICMTSRDIFNSEPSLLELEAPIKICGDIRGQFPNLLRLFQFGGPPPESRYLFLGNYVDYGTQNLETICLLLAYKIRYPNNIFLLRGSNECPNMMLATYGLYGLYEECRQKFNRRLWKLFIDCFNCLPLAALIEGKILCMHGGLSPELSSLDQIRTLARPTCIPFTGLLHDLLWSEPSDDAADWGMKYDDFETPYCTFGKEIVSKFLHDHNLDLICRGHQVVQDGFEFFADKQLVTLFSTPNHLGLDRQYNNTGAMMDVDATLTCTFLLLTPPASNA